MVERIKKAKNVLGVTEKARGVYQQRGQSDYISPESGHGWNVEHLTPWAKKAAKIMFFGQMLGRVAKQSVARCGTMRRVLHPKIRWGILARRFVRKLVRRRDGLLKAMVDRSKRKELEEAERDIFHAKVTCIFGSNNCRNEHLQIRSGTDA